MNDFKMAIATDVWSEKKMLWEPCIRWTNELKDGGYIQSGFPSVAIRDMILEKCTNSETFEILS